MPRVSRPSFDETMHDDGSVWRAASCTTLVIKEQRNSGRTGGRLSRRLARFRSNVCRIIANGCISDPQLVRHVSTRARPFLLSLTSNSVVSIIRNNIFFLKVEPAPGSAACSAARWWKGETKRNGDGMRSPGAMGPRKREKRERERERERERGRGRGVEWWPGKRGDKVAAAHAFVNVCRCRHPPTYANHLI